jgi:hypothetical protein
VSAIDITYLLTGLHADHPSPNTGQWAEVLAVIEFYGLCLGTTASGDPKHPLARALHRGPDDAKPQVWGAAS